MYIFFLKTVNTGGRERRVYPPPFKIGGLSRGLLHFHIQELSLREAHPPFVRLSSVVFVQALNQASVDFLAGLSEVGTELICKAAMSKVWDMK